MTQPAGPTCCGVAASAGPGPGAAQRSVTSEICAGVTVPAAARCTSAGQQGVLFSITARPPPAFHTREKAIWGQGWKVPLAASLLQLLEGSLLPPGGSRLDGACRPPPRPAGTGVSPKLQGQAGWWRFPGPVPRGLPGSAASPGHRAKPRALLQRPVPLAASVSPSAKGGS